MDELETTSQPPESEDNYSGEEANAQPLFVTTPTPKSLSSTSTLSQSIAIPLANAIEVKIIENGGVLYDRHNAITIERSVRHSFPKLNWKRNFNRYPHNCYVQGLDKDGIPAYFCKGCATSYRHPGCNGGGAGTHRKHLEKCTNLTNILNTPERQTTIDFNPIRTTEMVIRDLFVEWNASAGHSFYAIENTYLYKLWDVLKVNRKLPSRRTLRTWTLVYAETLRSTISSNIKQAATKVHLSLDAWTSPFNVAYLVIVAHYIDKDWCMQEQILEFCDLPIGHAGNTMAEIVYRVCDTYDIKVLLGTITTDNASDNRVMADTLSQMLSRDRIDWNAQENHLSCMAHIINLAAKQFLSTLKAEPPSRNETYAIEGLADELDLQKERVTGVAATLWRVRSFVKYVCSSPRREAAFENARSDVTQTRALKLIKDVTTRWNSTYYMVERIMRLQDQVNVYIVRTKELPQNIQLVPDDWTILDLLCKVLRPLELVSRLISATTKPTISQVWPSYLFIFQQMERWISNKQHCTDSYYEEIYVALSRAQGKLTQYYLASDGSYRYSIACLLDPEGKAEQLGHPDFNPAEYIETLRELYEDQEQSAHSDTEALTHETAQRGGSPSVLSKSKMNIASIRSVMSQGRPQKEKVDEITQYLNEDVIGEVDNILLWWKANEARFPRLAQIARDILSSVASSTGAERVFSTARDIHHYRRGHLNKEVISALVLIRSHAIQSSQRTNENPEYDSSIEIPYHDLVDKLRNEYDEAEAHENEAVRTQFVQQTQSQAIQNQSKSRTTGPPDKLSSTTQLKRQQTLPSMFKGKRKATNRMTYELDPGPVRRKRTPFVEANVENEQSESQNNSDFQYLTDNHPVPVYSSEEEGDY